jgi:hypothetical protein
LPANQPLRPTAAASRSFEFSVSSDVSAGELFHSATEGLENAIRLHEAEAEYHQGRCRAYRKMLDDLRGENAS